MTQHVPVLPTHVYAFRILVRLCCPVLCCSVVLLLFAGKQGQAGSSCAAVHAAQRASLGGGAGMRLGRLHRLGSVSEEVCAPLHRWLPAAQPHTQRPQGGPAHCILPWRYCHIALLELFRMNCGARQLSRLDSLPHCEFLLTAVVHHSTDVLYCLYNMQILHCSTAATAQQLTITAAVLIIIDRKNGRKKVCGALKQRRPLRVFAGGDGHSSIGSQARLTNGHR